AGAGECVVIAVQRRRRRVGHAEQGDDDGGGRGSRRIGHGTNVRVVARITLVDPALARHTACSRGRPAASAIHRSDTDMNLTDHAGHPVSGASGDGLAHFEQAAQQLRCFIGDPLATIGRALSASPAMTMAHVLKGWLHLLGTEPGGLTVARGCAAAAAPLAATERERRHVEAMRLVAHGRWREAGRVLEALSARYPRDALALGVGHQVDFFTGDSRMLRDRIARALPAWSPSMPGYHALLGMHAFGLEETGDYEQAERQGRRCVELEPRDGWGWHAVAHVIETRNRP